MVALCRIQLRQDSGCFFQTRCQAKFLTWEISDFAPCVHAQSNNQHVKCAVRTDGL